MRMRQYSCVRIRLFGSSLLCLNPIQRTSSLLHLHLTRGMSTNFSFSTTKIYDRFPPVSQSRRFYFSSFPPKVSVELLGLQSDSSVTREATMNTHANPLNQDTRFSLSGESPWTILGMMVIAEQDASTKTVAFRLDYRCEPNTSLMIVRYERGYRRRSNLMTSSRFCSVPDQVWRCRGVIIDALYIEN